MGSGEMYPPTPLLCLLLFLSSFPLLQKEVDAEIIPEKSKITVMRNGPSGKRLVLLLFVNVNRSATGQLRGYKYSRSTDAG